MKLPAELKSPKKGLIKIKNNNQKSFLWSHVRQINPAKIHPDRITREDKKIVNNLNYDGIEFSVQEKDFSKIEKKNNICINMFCCENKLVFPIYVSDQKFQIKTRWICCLYLMVINRIMYIKILTDLCFTKQKIKTKNGFVEVVYSVLVAKMCG